jgi:hypothetical protein
MFHFSFHTPFLHSPLDNHVGLGASLVPLTQDAQSTSLYVPHVQNLSMDVLGHGAQWSVANVCAVRGHPTPSGFNNHSFLMLGLAGGPSAGGCLSGSLEQVLKTTPSQQGLAAWPLTSDGPGLQSLPVPAVQCSHPLQPLCQSVPGPGQPGFQGCAKKLHLGGRTTMHCSHGFQSAPHIRVLSHFSFFFLFI